MHGDIPFLKNTEAQRVHYPSVDGFKVQLPALKIKW